MEIIFTAIVVILFVIISHLVILGVPKNIYYPYILRKYNYTEPTHLLKFKQAIFDAKYPLPLSQTFSLGNWYYYQYSKELFNPSERITLSLSEYEQIIIWYWIKNHNKQLM